MLTKFAVTGRDVRNRISVPTVPLAAIHAGAQAQSARAHVRGLVLFAVIAVAALGAGTGLAANYGGVRILLSGNRSAALIHSFMIVRNPMATDLARVTKDAAFSVVLPLGLPAGTHVAMIAYAPDDHPTAVIVQYRNDEAHLSVGVTLAATSALGGDSAQIPTGSTPLNQVYHWQVGSETVLVQKAHMSPQSARRMRNAMQRATPASSLAATGAMLSKLLVLEAPPNAVAKAQQYSSARGALLLGPPAIRRLAGIVARGQALFDTRAVFLSNIHTHSGAPDYRNATLHWPRHMLLSPSAARNVNAMIHARNLQNCECSILLTKATSGAYTIKPVPSS